mgnify:CR=1 FL=1
MEKTTHRYIVAQYELYSTAEGKQTLEEATTEEKPFAFLTGFGMAMEPFEKAVKDLSTGDKFDFTIECDNAYGAYEAERVVDLDKSIFSINNHFDHENIFEGAVIPLENEDGNRFLGRVVSIGEEKVKVDLNHPLAGKDLNFKGEIVEARDATDSEVEGFIKHIESHHCGCGDCEGDCHHDDHGCGCGCHHH